MSDDPRENEMCDCLTVRLFSHRRKNCKLGLGKSKNDKIVNTETIPVTNILPIEPEQVDVVIIGGGPVGLYFAKEMKIRSPHINIVIIERFSEYSRHHVVKIEEHFLNTASQAHTFFRLASSATPLAFTSTISPTKTMSIMELEQLWREEALSLGIQIKIDTVTDPASLESEYPSAKVFVGADGSKSATRKMLFGDEKSLDHTYQHMVELKYKLSSGNAHRISSSDLFKTRKVLNNFVTEYVRKDEEVIVRFLVDDETFQGLPECTHRSPLFTKTHFLEIPPGLREDILTYLNVRRHLFEIEWGENFEPTVTKTSLGIYKASSVAKCPDSVLRGHWFLVGDAAMGVPFFRSLNAGLEAATKLIDMLTDLGVQILGQSHGLSLAVTRHNTFYSVISARERTEAWVKCEGIDSTTRVMDVAGNIDLFAGKVTKTVDKIFGSINIDTKFSSMAPQVLDSWTAEEIELFQSAPHPACEN